MSLAYEAYLKSPAWKKLREEAISRSKGKCWRCGKKLKHGSVEVHHLRYLQSLKDITVKDLRAVHSKCHKEISAKSGVIEFELK